MSEKMTRKPCIVWQTDFTLSWGAVASMRGVCKSVDPELECVDITHEIEPYSILAASREIVYVEPFWPKGTIFVSVVDPGVGTSRRACAAKLKDGNYLITPDHGSLTHAFHQVGIEAVREIDETVNRWKGTEEISVFHGRDLFAYTAARLAAGIIDFEGVGPEYPVSEIVLLDEALVRADVEEGAVSCVVGGARDPFGSVTFNATIADFARAGFRHGDTVKVSIRHAGKDVFTGDVLYHKSFGYVPLGEPILFNSSTGYISIGLNQGSFLSRYPCQTGKEWTVELRRS